MLERFKEAGTGTRVVMQHIRLSPMILAFAIGVLVSDLAFLCVIQLSPDEPGEVTEDDLSSWLAVAY